MNTTKKIYWWMIFSSIITAAFHAHADTVNYQLDRVILDDGEQITGTFAWTFDVGDFEGGSGVFTELEIPWTPHDLGDPDLNIEIQTTSIELTGVGNYHDAGLDVRLKFDAFTPTQSVPLDLDLSFFECCGNGFKDQPFRSGSISPNSTRTGDMDCDGDVDFDDIDAFVLGLNDPGGYEDQFGVPPEAKGDTDGDGDLDFDDIDDFVAIVTAPDSAAIQNVPEPGTAALLCLSVGVSALRRRLNCYGI